MKLVGEWVLWLVNKRWSRQKEHRVHYAKGLKEPKIFWDLEGDHSRERGASERLRPDLPGSLTE